MIDYNKLSNIMYASHGNNPVEIVMMQKTSIKIYPGGKIFPGKTQTWIEGVNIVKQKAPMKTKKLEVEDKVGKVSAWENETLYPLK